MNQVRDLINNHELNMHRLSNNPIQSNAAQRLSANDTAQVMAEKWKKTYQESDLETNPN